MRTADLLEVLPERGDEGAHVIVGSALARNPRQEGLGRTQLARPFEYVLISAVDLAGGFSNGDREFVPRFPKARLLRCLGDLGDHSLEDGVSGRKRDSALYLDLHFGGLSGLIACMDDDVVERLALTGALKFHAFDRRAWQASWFGTHKHRQQVVRAYLAFE